MKKFIIIVLALATVAAHATDFKIVNVPTAEGVYEKLIKFNWALDDINEQVPMIDSASNQLLGECLKNHKLALTKIFEVYHGQVLVNEGCKRISIREKDGLRVGSKFFIEFKL